MIPGHNGRYSDDPLEDSLLRDDEQRLLDEMDEESRQQNNSNSNGWAGLIGIIAMIALIFYVLHSMGILAFLL
ncbi:MAG: hypothetical protein J6I76_17760 [Oribacterium sp.]|nr:hypothetical protein [Oribacterium sp.]